MSFIGRRPSILFVFLSLSVVACTDKPSDVGIGLVDSQAGAPQDIIQEATVFNSRSDADVTGGEAASGAIRALAGRVEDPSLGIIDVRGYIDFVQLTALSTNFKTSAVTFVELSLISDYVYGDTLSEIGLRLTDISDEWRAIGVPADTSIGVGAVASESSFLPMSDTLKFQFSQAWITRNAPLLQSDDPINAFHGFQIDYVAGNAVVGFGLPGSIMRVAVPGDTVSFQVTRVLSTITRDEPDIPSGFVLLQDGTRPRADLEFDFSSAQLQANAIHRSTISIGTGNPDLITPTGFIRPTLSTLSLAGVTSDVGVGLTLSTASIDENGRFLFDNNVLNTVVQNIVLGKGNFQRFEIFAPVPESTLDVLFINDMPGGNGPSATFTVTAIQ